MIVVHRAERADVLAGALGDLLLDSFEDPMAVEVVAVPTRGVERWLTQQLSHRLGTSSGNDGICANIAFPFPGSLVQAATSAACGFDAESDPWPPDRSVWPLLEVVDASLGTPWLAPLVAHLRAGSPAGADGDHELRRFATVRHLADLYDRYAVHRPEMVQRWAAGLEEGLEDDGSTVDPETPEWEAHWQARLWRRLRCRIGVPSPAERLGIAAARLTEEPALVDLPPRLSLFGMTGLPAGHLGILEAIGRGRDVHLFLLHPSGALWDAVEAADRGSNPLRRSADPTVALAAHPLLRSWGRDSREMQLVLEMRGVAGGEHRGSPATSSDTEMSLLQRLQSDIRANRRPGGPPSSPSDADARPPLHPDDDSLRVHSCHGRLRQVEVMRDAVLHLLSGDPTLEPRDVIVMCPDIDSFAPLISAVFASSGRATGYGQEGPVEPGTGPPQMRVRLADRSIRQTNPMLSVAAQLLELAAGRVSASEVLDFAGREPVARRFRFDEDELGQLERWVVATGVRWGLDADHRTPWRLERVDDNTWHAGLDRLLLGVAMAEEDHRLYGGVLPLDDVSSGTVDLAGRFAEFMERLGGAVERMQGRRTIGEWSAVLTTAVESLAMADPHEQWQQDQLRWVLSDVVEASAVAARASAEAAGPSPAALDLAEVRSLVEGRLRGRPTRANFRTGDLTICTLVPMRSVPHRVVGLLGLDDGAFPRHVGQDGDDLLVADPRVGDRDARSEDRQLLLDALLAATEHLIVTYEGRDPRTNQERPPCVPIAELLDVVDRTVRAPVGSARTRAQDHVVIEHPLQSFDPRNFVAGGPAGDEPWSFDPVDLAGARSHAQPPLARRPFLSRRLGRLDSQVVQLDSLVRFLEHPVRAFLRERLGWYGGEDNNQVKDELPVELDPLERWGVGDRMLAGLLAGATLEQARDAELGRGLLPPGALASDQLREIEESVQALATLARREAATADAVPSSVEVNVRLGDGRLLIGTVPDVYATAPSEGAGRPTRNRIVRCVYSQLGPKHRLCGWARFLALSAAHPEREVSGVTIGRAGGTTGRRPRIAVAELPPLGHTADERRALSLSLLAVLVDLYDRGMREPLPLYARTSETYVDASSRDKDVRSACAETWSSRFGEASEAEHVLVLGATATIDRVLEEPARADEAGAGWGEERSRFGRLARRLWGPVVVYERRDYRS
ncbi:MAG: exodeoxyribonuclease V subunit gamma [Actinomycetota bacterium]|nr:exodeoxyribonuclease V subunit gamma [Actinomycetota bacterium]